MDRFEVTPGAGYEWSGGIGGTASTDVTYFKGSEVCRVVRAITSPHRIEPEEGETHFAVSIRIDDVAGEPFYVD